MIDPAEPMCGPAACLRAEAEDLEARATVETRYAEDFNRRAQEATNRAEAFLALSSRYHAAASMLDEAGEQEAQG